MMFFYICPANIHKRTSRCAIETVQGVKKMYRHAIPFIEYSTMVNGDPLLYGVGGIWQYPVMDQEAIKN